MSKKRVSYLLMAALIILSMILNGCASSSKSTSAEYIAREENKSFRSQVESNNIQEDNMSMKSESEQENLQKDVSEIRAKIIYTAELTLETKAFDKSVEDILNEVKSLGGYAENINKTGISLYSEQSERSAELVVRIPSKSFDDFVSRSNKFGNIVSENVKGENVSEQYFDTEARVKALKIRQERLMALMEQSGSLEDLFQIEKELANVGYEIESLTGTLNKLDNLIDFSTVTISVREVREYKEPIMVSSFGDDIKNTFLGSVKSLIQVFKTALIILVALLPYSIVIGLIAIIVIFTVKKLKGVSKKSKRSVFISDDNKKKEHTNGELK